MKIGLLASGFMEWNGGLDFLSGIYRSLRSVDAVDDVFVIIPNGGLKSAVKRAVRAASYVRRGIARSRQSAGRSRVTNAVSLFAELAGQERVFTIRRVGAAVSTLSKELQIDVLLPSFHILPASVNVPWIGYLYDAQHRYLENLFSPQERKRRDKQFRAMVEAAPAILVNSAAVKRDLVQFYGASDSAVIALPFSAAAPSGWFEDDPKQVAARYLLRAPYFIICNQFWKHKDHGTAFRAFAAFARRFPEVSLVCTGAQEDFRDPGYFGSLRRIISDEHLEARIRLLGLVPKSDQIGLMRGAMAVIQPTLFEGGPGGGAVFDAVAVGTPAIVSDIEVNRELNLEGVTFFSAGDAEALARELASCYEARGHSVRRTRDQLLAEGVQRQVKCGNQIVDSIRQVLVSAAR